MKTFPSPVIGHFLFPYWNKGAIIPNPVIERREWRSYEDVRRFLFLQICLEGLTRSLEGHWRHKQCERSWLVVSEVDLDCGHQMCRATKIFTMQKDARWCSQPGPSVVGY
jgi:hypothetical protein